MFLEFEKFTSDKETQTYKFAVNFLLPQENFQEFISGRNQYTHQAVISFAKELNIDPGIVVGRLQHGKFIEFSSLNDLKVGFNWKDDQKIYYIS